MSKILPSIILIVVLFFVMNSYQFSAQAIQLQSSSDDDMDILDVEMQIQNSQTLEYENVDDLLVDTTTPYIKNGSNIRFQASIRNLAAPDMQLKSFKATLYNETAKVTAFEKSYPSDVLSTVTLSARQIKTDRIEGKLIFPDAELIYHIQLTFVYIFTTNISNILELHAAENITIAVFTAEAAPPIYILWGIGICSSFLIFMFALGYYGERKKKQDVTETSK
ncbi:MAG: hypothetical protein ACTSRU_14525 [Candidatus Hodarchaeales archaeon]